MSPEKLALYLAQTWNGEEDSALECDVQASAQGNVVYVSHHHWCDDDETPRVESFRFTIEAAS
jgi:hypothetical protein